MLAGYPFYAHYLLGGPGLEIHEGLLGVIGGVGGDQAVREADQRVVRWDRLLLEDVQPGPGDPAFSDRPGDRPGVDQRATRRIDQESGRLHEPQRPFADEMLRLGGQRSVDRDEVRLAQERFEVGRHGATLGDLLGAQVGIVGQDAAAQRRGLAAERRPDPPEAYHAHRLLLQAEDRFGDLGIPPAGLDGVAERHDLAGERQ